MTWHYWNEVSDVYRRQSGKMDRIESTFHSFRKFEPGRVVSEAAEILRRQRQDTC